MYQCDHERPATPPLTHRWQHWFTNYIRYCLCLQIDAAANPPEIRWTDHSASLAFIPAARRRLGCDSVIAIMPRYFFLSLLPFPPVLAQLLRMLSLCCLLQ